MVEKGVVLEKRGGKIVVKVERRSACGGCKACESNEKREMTLELLDTLDAQKGDTVEIELDDSAMLKGAALMYGVPLLALIAGISAGKAIAETAVFTVPAELLSALFGAVFMAVALIGVKIYSSRNRDRYKPRAARILKGGEIR